MNVPDTKCKIQGPLHQFGYYDSQLNEIFNKKELKKFYDWMNGQTVMCDEDGRTIYYMEDVIRFLRSIRDGIPTYWD